MEERMRLKKQQQQKNPKTKKTKLEGSDKICFLLVSEERQAVPDLRVPASFKRINHFTPDGDQQWSSLREVWKPEENKVFQLPLCFRASQRSARLQWSVSHLLVCDFSGSSLWTGDWLGGATFPCFSSQEKLEICPFSKLPETFSRQKINCVTAALDVPWMSSALLLPAWALPLSISEGFWWGQCSGMGLAGWHLP